MSRRDRVLVAVLLLLLLGGLAVLHGASSLAPMP